MKLDEVLDSQYRIWVYLVAAGVAVALWDTSVIKPFRVFVVLVHEMGHATAALLTGGSIVELRTNWDESGHANTIGGFVPLISSAGYVGSAMLGSAIIYIGSWPIIHRISVAVVGGAALAASLLFSPLFSVDFLFGVASGLILLIVSIHFGRAARWLAAWIGVMLCLYSLYDFRTDLWENPSATDAGILAAYWGIPLLAYPIALVWAGFSIAVMGLALRSVDRGSSRPNPSATGRKS
jgi:hypothetical protein